MDFEYELDDFDDYGEIDLFDESDNAEDGNYKVWFIGLDANGKSTGYEYLYGSYETQSRAEEAIDDFFDEINCEIRNDFMIPNDVVSLEITGELVSEEFFTENDVFYSRPFDLSCCD